MRPAVARATRMPRNPLRRTTLRRLRAAGLPAALGLLAACAGARPAAGPFPQLQQYEGREVERVEFEGEIVVPRDTLSRVVTTRATSCQFLGVIPFLKFRNWPSQEPAAASREFQRISEFS